MDCMEGMKAFPDKYFDLAIVDPPYGLGTVNFCSKGRGIHREGDWNDKIPPKEYFNELYRVSKNQIIWGCNYFKGMIKDPGRIVWDKKIPKYGLQEFSDCDLASQSFTRTIKLFTYEWRGNVQNGKINWKNSGSDKRIHPTQKPIQLYKWILNNYAKPDFKILDTHAGSCSSVIAFLDFGCDWIAFEIDKDYYEAASKRIEIHKQQLKLF